MSQNFQTVLASTISAVTTLSNRPLIPQYPSISSYVLIIIIIQLWSYVCKCFFFFLVFIHCLKKNATCFLCGWIIKEGGRGITMSEVFEVYEHQYCELSANLSSYCTAATVLDGGYYHYICFLWISHLFSCFCLFREDQWGYNEVGI